MPQTGPAPTVQFNRLGVSQILICPRVPGASYASLIATATFSVIGRPQSMDFDYKVKTAASFGGESIWRRDSYNYESDIATKFVAQKTDFSMEYAILNGTLIVRAPTSVVGQIPNEQQYFAPNLQGIPQYFTIIAQSTFGDDGVLYVMPKVKLEAGEQANLDRTKITDLTIDTMLNWDDTYIRMDGAPGGIMEQIFTGGGPLPLHS